MTTETADAALRTAQYVLDRLTTWFGQRPDEFSAFIDGNVRAEGWLPAEAFYALSGPVSRLSIQVSMVRGKAQGSSTFDPDFELDIEHESHQLAVVPVLTSPGESLSDQLDTNLAEVFKWLGGAMKPKAMIYMLAFPAGVDDDEWKAALAKAEEKYEAKSFGEQQFVIPRPPRAMVRGSAALFLHSSRVPQTEA